MIFDFKQRTISAQFSNGEQLCFFESPPHFKFLALSCVSEDLAYAISRSTSTFGAGFLLQKTKSSPDRHRALHGCLIFSFFSFPPRFLFQKTDRSHAIFETNGHRLYLDFRIYFSFPVALPVSEKDCSHAFSATNEYHLCLDFRIYFSFPPHFLFRKKTAPTQFSRQTGDQALLGFLFLFQFSAAVSCFGNSLSNFPQQTGIGFVWIPFLFQLSAALSCFRKRMTSA